MTNVGIASKCKADIDTDVFSLNRVRFLFLLPRIADDICLQIIKKIIEVGFVLKLLSRH